MKTNLKKLFIAVACLISTEFAFADNERPITVNQLPKAAQQVLTKHFGNEKVSLAKYESGLIEKNYDVILANGTKLEFDRKGAWTEVDCKFSTVPTALIPQPIINYIKQNQAGSSVKKIEKDRGLIEVKLDNGVELTFNSKYKIVDIDY